MRKNKKPFRINHAITIALTGIVFIASTMSILSFCLSIPVEEANINPNVNIKNNADYVVYSHGKYYKWYSINSNPMLFILSLFGVMTSLLVIAYILFFVNLPIRFN